MRLDDRHAKAARLLGDGLSQVEVADVLGVTPRTVRRWQRAGKIPSVSPNGSGSKKPSFTEARARKEWAMAQKHELQLQQMRGDLVPAEDVNARIRGALEPVEVALRTAHTRLARDWSERLGISEGEAVHLIRGLADDVRASIVEKLEQAGS